MNTPIKNTALIGFGTVGQGFYHYLVENNEDKQLSEIVIKDASKNRIPENLNFTNDVQKVLNNKEINTIIELINNDQEAYKIVKEALQKGRKVVSANKKMIAYHLEELVALEQQFGGKFLYEGAVAGSIPIIKIINEHYAFDEIKQMRGILNGTSNYILTQVFEKGISYEEALFQAQEAGFAEVDSTADVGGFDALYKLLILSAHAFGKFILPEKVLNIGIENISKSDIEFAQNNRLKIKLVASAIKQNNKLVLYVLPTFVDEKNELFNVNNEYNTVEIVSNNIGSQTYIGKGAGKLPTGHVVYNDYSSLDSNKYIYKNVSSGKKLRYEINEFIWIYSNKITLLENFLEEIQLINGAKGYGKIKIKDLIKNKQLINVNKASIITLTENELNRFITDYRVDNKLLEYA
jgi:homoserine dehydrogenase